MSRGVACQTCALRRLRGGCQDTCTRPTVTSAFGMVSLGLKLRREAPRAGASAGPVALEPLQKGNKGKLGELQLGTLGAASGHGTSFRPTRKPLDRRTSRACAVLYTGRIRFVVLRLPLLNSRLGGGSIIANDGALRERN